MVTYCTSVDDIDEASRLVEHVAGTSTTLFLLGNAIAFLFVPEAGVDGDPTYRLGMPIALCGLVAFIWTWQGTWWE